MAEAQPIVIIGLVRSYVVGHLNYWSHVPALYRVHEYFEIINRYHSRIRILHVLLRCSHEHLVLDHDF